MFPAMLTKTQACDAGYHQPVPACAPAVPAAPGGDHLAIDLQDWDTLFDAVIIRLRCSVGEDLHNPPDVPSHSAALSASLIQAVVLDCVGALDKLHAALKHERSQRPTP